MEKTIVNLNGGFMQDFVMPAPERFAEMKSRDDDNDNGGCRRTMILGMDAKFWILMVAILGFLAGLFLILGPECFAQTSLPGSDASDKLEAAGTLLRILDTALFKWGARIFAGICIMSAAWSLKEQRFGIAIICIVGALIFGTAPTWVKNIFSIGAGDSIFSN